MGSFGRCRNCSEVCPVERGAWRHASPLRCLSCGALLDFCRGPKQQRRPKRRKAGAGEYSLGFGMHRNKPLRCVPLDYLRWVAIIVLFL